MRRITILALFLVLSLPIFAVTERAGGERIGILASSSRYVAGMERDIADAIRGNLRRHLRNGGLDAFDARMTYDELRRADETNADYYVEIIGGGTEGTGSYGGAWISDGHVGAEISVVVSRVAAELRLYDGKSLELIETYDLAKRNTAVLPTAIGLGGRHLYAMFGLPFVRYAQYRTAARAIAADAARQIIADVRR